MGKTMETDSLKIWKLKGENKFEKEDIIAIEKRVCVCAKGSGAEADGADDIPSEDEKRFSMSCTPSYLEELVLGQLFSRGEITAADQVTDMMISADAERIHVQISSHCDGKNGLINKVSGQVLSRKLPVSLIFRTAAALFENPSPFFSDTGCAHSCTLVLDDRIICTMEDIGRHNALDKVIGYALKHKLPVERAVIFTSGRISGDYLQKVIHAGIKIAVSRAAVTSEAIALARKENITLLGFVRNYSGNIYHEGTVLLQ